MNLSTNKNKLDGIPPIHIVSLNESEDRRNNLERWFSKFNITNYKFHLFKRFEENDYIINGKYSHLLEPDGKGSITSHFIVLKEWYESTSEPYCLVVEDDLSLETVDYWNFTWKEFENNLPHEWNCIQLVIIRENYCQEYFFQSRDINDWCAAAYLIRREYVKQLLDSYYIDNIFNLTIENLEYPPVIEHLLFSKKSKVYCLPLFVEDIINTQSTFRYKEKLYWGHGQYHHNSYYDVMSWWKNKGFDLSISEIVGDNFNKWKQKYNMSITGVIQIGSYFGENVKKYINGGIENIVLFEPLKNNFDILCKNMQDIEKNITCHQIALGCEHKNVFMYVSNDNQKNSSILKPKNYFKYNSNVYFPYSEEVEVNCLDSFEYTDYNYLHIDVSEYGLDILKGSLKTLDNIDYLYCKVINNIELYEKNSLISDIDDFLSEKNMKRVETYWSNEFYGEALYIKAKNDYQKCIFKTDFAHKKELVILDVGCNINNNLDDFTEIFFDQYPNSKCVAIDPIFWQDYEKKWGSDSRVTIVKKALSDSSKNKFLYVPSIYGDGSGLTSFYKMEVFEQNYKQFETECITLDDLVLNLNIDCIDYLKIDTEGSELTILNGSKNLLKNKKIEYIQLEYGPTYEDAGYSVLDIVEYLNFYGYKLIYKTKNYWNNIPIGEILFTKF